MRPTLLITGCLALFALAAPAGAAGGGAVWGGCDGRQELIEPAKVSHCAADVTYSLYVDQVQWAAFGGAQATGIGTAYVNACDVNCDYGIWRQSGSASVTLSRPRACGDRTLYTHGLIQLQNAYEGRTVYEENYPCTQIVRHCSGSLRGGALRSIDQRATTCANARTIARSWASVSGYRVRATTRARVRVGAYSCRRVTLEHHQLQVTCTASGQRLVRFRAL